ncbi:hypothetical protein [Nocardia puris]|uniref:Uncharacterized protein n=1 Tax=Nocardia puris TaxID=208602 RepID=A0A366DJD1_9NOCA|nr:hypothetical protein [Nocardia puris]RBO90192.1 hypothetical protein DFR74_10677 [Nocardia puris]
MNLLTMARIAAVPVSLWLLIALIANPEYRTHNIFTVPDFGFSLYLLAVAALPTRIAAPALTAGFCFGAGVITVAAIDRFDRGDTAQGALNLLIVAAYLVVATLLLRRQARTSQVETARAEAAPAGVPAT